MKEILTEVTIAAPKPLHFSLALLVFIGYGLSAQAQLPTATISGVVKDARGCYRLSGEAVGK